MFTVNYKDPRPIYEQVKHGLRQMVLDGTIAPGGKLPSVREMAVKLAINPNTIQRAYRELEQEGIVFSVPGKGSFASDDLTKERAAIEEGYEKLDEIVLALKALGISAEEICRRIIGGESL